jgi:predicted nucleotidyltransferase component of viral defense system
MITAWGTRVPWSTVEQVEQDLVLARIVAEIANDAFLANELVFRGGTCLHMLRLPQAFRYSEDLDYVRVSAGGIGPLTTSLTSLGERLGMEVRTRVGRFPKVYFTAPFEAGTGTMRVKIEVNTYERFPARPLERVLFTVESDWYSGTGDVLTFSMPELVATKLRALYQRTKGRDLLDLWLGLHELEVAPADVIECFEPYRPNGYTRGRAERNLRAKVANEQFRNDLLPLLPAVPAGYTIDAAANEVVERALSLM